MLTREAIDTDSGTNYLQHRIRSVRHDI